MTTSIDKEIQAFDGNSIVHLYQIDLSALGGSVYYITSSADESSAIVFDLNTYTPMPIEASGFEWTGTGPIPTPVIKINNTTQFFNALISDLGDLLGGKVTRIRTFRRFLDGELDADPTATFPLDVYTIDRKSAQNKYFVEFELASVMDQHGRKIPARQLLRDNCPFVYRRYDSVLAAFVYTDADCPYTGANCFKRDDVATMTNSEDDCGKRLTSCRARFGTVLPFGGFPMIARGGM